MNGFNDFLNDFEDIQYSPGYIPELEQKINLLESQNKQIPLLKSECDRLNIELKHMTTLKDTFEEKYNEASMKLIYIEEDDSFVFSESEQMKSLNEKIKILIHANEDLRTEIETSKAELAQVKYERDSFKSQVDSLNNSIHQLLTQKIDKEVMTENSQKKPSKELSLDEDLVFFETTPEQYSNMDQRKNSLDILKKNESQQVIDNFSRTFSSSIKVNLEKNQETEVSSLSKNFNSPKLKLKPPLSRQSPKVKVSKKKSVYIPSFMRSANKLSKK